jgi:hypothetical protein
VRVILNSDVAYGDYVRHGLPKALVAVAEACAEHGHILSIPRTALLEIDRRQRELADDTREKVRDAHMLLKSLGVPVDDIDAEVLVTAPEVIDLFRAHCPNVEVLEPSLEDFQSAHERACLHLSPHPPETKSDEMRDLVIWVTALRYAAVEGQALLISKDVVHAHERGSAEADAAGLSRATSVEDALDYLALASPARQLLETVLAPAWGPLRDAGLPIGTEPVISSARAPSFLQAAWGIAEASAAVTLTDGTGATTNGAVLANIGEDGTGRATFMFDAQDGYKEIEASFIPAATDEGISSEALDALKVLVNGSGQ